MRLAASGLRGGKGEPYVRRIVSGLQHTMREYENRSAGRFSFFSETTADD
jgi:hypothetical protein